MFRIAIADRQRAIKLDARRLRRIVRAVLRDEAVRDADISLAFVTDAEIAELNERFLQHRGPTDVITFPLENAPLSGELVISTETARAEASARGHAAAEELALYVIHGLLHLCGHDDRTSRQRQAMRARERHHLAALGIHLGASP